LPIKPSHPRALHANLLVSTKFEDVVVADLEVAV